MIVLEKKTCKKVVSHSYHTSSKLYLADNAASMKRPKGRDVVHQLRASLEELYNGTKKKLSLNRKELCPKCDGQGGTVSNYKFVW